MTRETLHERHEHRPLPIVTTPVNGVGLVALKLNADKTMYEHVSKNLIISVESQDPGDVGDVYGWVIRGTERPLAIGSSPESALRAVLESVAPMLSKDEVVQLIDASNRIMRGEP